MSLIDLGLFKNVLLCVLWGMCECPCDSAHVENREQLSRISSFLLPLVLGIKLRSSGSWGKFLYLFSYLAGLLPYFLRQGFPLNLELADQ